MNRWRILALACVSAVASGSVREGRAQGLIVRLPKDGAWVRFEGTVKQLELRPEAPEGDIPMEWIQHLTIKSVGRETAPFRGKQVPCRWIEIKVVTGKAGEAGVEAGPVGERLYKVLVPEERVIGQVADRDNVPFSFLDIVKGFRKMGGEVTPLPAGSLQVVPLIAPLMHYDAVKATRFKAKRVIESPTLRTTNEAEIWRCDSETIPFGLARWSVKISVEKKDSAQPRSTFKPVTQTTIEMSAHESGSGAKSELTNH
jgi:hypothetical protein